VRLGDILGMVIQLQPALLVRHPRYLAVVTTRTGPESHFVLLLGIDCTSIDAASIGLVVPLWQSTRLELDGDGGILLECDGTVHVFKPVSVKAMWSAFQCLHRERSITICSQRSSAPYSFLHHYHSQISSSDLSRGQWHHSDSDDTAELRARPLHQFIERPLEQKGSEDRLRAGLREIMQSVDLAEVTSRDIRMALKQNLAPDDYLVEQYRGFVENEMLVILGQLDKPSQIFEYLYLGTEWNASNWDELNANNVKYILNMTKEVDNFYPSHFQYMKIPVSDHDSTELLKHWNRTFEFIKRAKECKAGVLVHCKKGISRSSSTVIAYAMKAYGWSLSCALEHVKRKRDCITPNPGFMRQLEVYDGMLAAKNSFLNGSHLLHKSNQPIPRGSRWRSRQPRITDPSVLFVALSDPTETKDENGGVRALVEVFEGSWIRRTSSVPCRIRAGPSRTCTLSACSSTG